MLDNLKMFVLLLFLCIVIHVYGLNDLCFNEQLIPLMTKNSSGCKMVYYDPVHDRDRCNALNFTISECRDDFGTVILTPFVYEAHTTINVSQFSVPWKRLKMRFKERNLLYSHCREFIIGENEFVTLDECLAYLLYYDCPWSDAGIEGQTVDFEYEFEIPGCTVGKKVSFIVPKHENIDPRDINNLELFAYVGVSCDRYLLFQAQTAPQKFNISQYEIEVTRTLNNETITVHREIKTQRNGQIELLFNTLNKCGEYIFYIKPLHEMCTNSCQVSWTPSVFIRKCEINFLRVGIVGGSAMIPVILIVLYMWKKQCFNIELFYRFRQIKLLLVYTPYTDEHINVVTTLATLLRDFYHIQIMIDIFDVPLTKSKDPFIWFTSAFNNATHVAFILSPDIVIATKTIYKDIDNLAIRLMKEEFSTKNSTKQFAVITLPYSSENIPIELINLRRFNFMAQFNDFLANLQKPNFWQRIGERTAILRYDLYSKLENAIQIADKCGNIGSDCKSNFEFEYKRNLKIVDDDEVKAVLLDSKKKKNQIDSDDYSYTYNANHLNLLGTKNNEETDKKNKTDS